MNKQTLIDSWNEYVAPSQALSPEEMAKRVARWGGIPASPRAFVDTYVKGHERTLYSVIGSGVTDDPIFRPSIAAAENFHVDYIVAPKGCGAALPWHDSGEVFLLHAGPSEHPITLGPRDTISVPPFVHRAFRSLDGDDPVTGGMLVSVLGGKTPGRVMWDAALAEKAKAVGAGFGPDGMAAQAQNT